MTPLWIRLQITIQVIILFRLVIQEEDRIFDDNTDSSIQAAAQEEVPAAAPIQIQAAEGETEAAAKTEAKTEPKAEAKIGAKTEAKTEAAKTEATAPKRKPAKKHAKKPAIKKPAKEPSDTKISKEHRKITETSNQSKLKITVYNSEDVSTNKRKAEESDQRLHFFRIYFSLQK